MSVLRNMSQTTQQLQQDLQNELTTANQLLRLILHSTSLNTISPPWYSQLQKVSRHLIDFLDQGEEEFKILHNQLSVELQHIKYLTNPGGDFEANISKNTSSIKILANLQHINIEKLPPFTRKQIDLSMHENQNVPCEHSTFRNDSEMEESQ